MKNGSSCMWAGILLGMAAGAVSGYLLAANKSKINDEIHRLVSMLKEKTNHHDEDGRSCECGMNSANA